MTKHQKWIKKIKSNTSIRVDTSIIWSTKRYQPIFHSEGKIYPEYPSLSLSPSPFLKFNERLVHERFPTTAMGFPQDQTRPTISFLRPLSAMVNLIPGKSPGRRAFCIAITEPRMCVTFESSGGLKRGNEHTSPLLKPLLEGALSAFSRHFTRKKERQMWMYG